MNCLMAIPLVTANVQPVVEEFNPQIWDDGGNKYIYDVIKKNISQLEDEFTSFHVKWGELHPHPKKKFLDAMIGINEIVGWLEDQDPNNRKNWRDELFKKITKLQADFDQLGGFTSSGVRTNMVGVRGWSQNQLDELRPLKKQILLHTTTNQANTGF